MDATIRPDSGSATATELIKANYVTRKDRFIWNDDDIEIQLATARGIAYDATRNRLREVEVVDEVVMKPSRRGRENSLPARADSQFEGPGMQATIVSTDAERIPFWSALIRDRRIALALGLGFTSGMPFLLIYSTQSAWLTDAGVPLATIGLLSELTLAYKFKFVWAPFLDQYDPDWACLLLTQTGHPREVI
jgi:hypothetical protein